MTAWGGVVMMARQDVCWVEGSWVAMMSASSALPPGVAPEVITTVVVVDSMEMCRVRTVKRTSWAECARVGGMILSGSNTALIGNLLSEELSLPHSMENPLLHHRVAIGLIEVASK
jgi:hypothetical protein